MGRLCVLCVCACVWLHCGDVFLAFCFHVGVDVDVDDIVAMASWLDCCCCGTLKLLVWTICGGCAETVGTRG